MAATPLVTAVILSLLGAEPLWPDLSKLPASTGGGEKDAAVVVAVEDYVFLPDVVGAKEVGTAWFTYLKKVRKMPVVLLLQDGEATVNKLKDQLSKAAKKVQPGGRVWFVFIGHGAPSKDGKDGLLVGATAQADEMDFYPHTVSRGEVLKILSNSGTGVLPPILLLDACFSGTDVSGKTLIKGAQFVVSEEISENPNDKATILTAGRAKDIAGPLPGSAKPAFSYLMLGALRGWGDANRDGTVTALEAIAYTQDALMSLDPGRMQEPQQSGLDQPLTPKLDAHNMEKGPDLADLRLKLTGAGPGSGMNAQTDLDRQLADLEKARAEREAAEKREAELKTKALAEHSSAVKLDWLKVKKVADKGGPEGKVAVELFLKKYKGHPLGNPFMDQANSTLAQLQKDRPAVTTVTEPQRAKSEDHPAKGRSTVPGISFGIGGVAAMITEPDEGKSENLFGPGLVLQVRYGVFDYIAIQALFNYNRYIESNYDFSAISFDIGPAAVVPIWNFFHLSTSCSFGITDITHSVINGDGGTNNQKMATISGDIGFDFIINTKLSLFLAIRYSYDMTELDSEGGSEHFPLRESSSGSARLGLSYTY